MNFQESHTQLVEEKNALYKKRRELEERLQEAERYIQNHEQKIQFNCVKWNKKHDWEYCREEGPYGERYTRCKYCGLENW